MVPILVFDYKDKLVFFKGYICICIKVPTTTLFYLLPTIFNTKDIRRTSLEVSSDKDFVSTLTLVTRSHPTITLQYETKISSP